MGYAALDELTQAIPGLGRTAGLDDFAADVLGVTLGVAAGAVVLRVSVGRGFPTRGNAGEQAPPTEAVLGMNGAETR